MECRNGQEYSQFQGRAAVCLSAGWSHCGGCARRHDSILQTGSGHEVSTYKVDFNEEGIALAFNGDGTRLAVGGLSSTDEGYQGPVVVIDAATGAEQVRLEGHTGRVTRIVCSADGTLMATGGKDKSVRVWNAGSGEEMAVLKGHGNDITGLLFGPRNKRLLTASMDGTFKIWDIAGSREVMTLQDSALESQNYPGVIANSDDWRRVVTITEPEAMQPFV